MKSIKLRTRKGEMSQRFADGDSDDDLHEWISDKIPPMPEGQLCERHLEIQLANAEEFDDDGEAIIERSAPAEAGYYVWNIKGDHVCYSYICENCSDMMDLNFGASADDYPTTKAGYAVSPRHCT